MTTPELHLVDVFTSDRYAGNQLAVVESYGAVSAADMQAFAAEIGFSETTYIESDAPPYRVRIFTPETEIPFAGHPTLGTAHVIREHVADGSPEEVVLDLDVGEVPVEARDGETGETRLWMTQQSPTFGAELSPAELAEVLSVPHGAIDDRWPVQVVSTGLATTVVPLVDREALTAIELDREAYDRVTGDREAKNVLAVCPDPRDEGNDLAVRVFAPFYGVPEDPATGSSNGCLAAYLAHHRYVGDPTVNVRVEQGHEIERPSLLGLRATDRGEEVHVEVGGQVVPVARGELL